jgi:hypothetical protein
MQLNMFLAFSCPSSGAQQLQSQPLFYRWNVVVAVPLVVVGPAAVSVQQLHGQQPFMYENQRMLVQF